MRNIWSARTLGVLAAATLALGAIATASADFVLYDNFEGADGNGSVAAWSFTNGGGDSPYGLKNDYYAIHSYDGGAAGQQYPDGHFDMFLRTGSTGSLTTTYTLQPNDQITLSAYVISLYNNPGYDMKLYTQNTDGTKNYLQPVVSAASTPGGDQNAWVKTPDLLYTAPDNAPSLKLGIEFVAHPGNGGATDSWLGIDNVSLSVVSSSVPEPASLSVLGASGLVLMSRRRSSRK